MIEWGMPYLHLSYIYFVISGVLQSKMVGCFRLKLKILLSSVLFEVIDHCRRTRFTYKY